MSRANLTGGPGYITWDGLAFQPQDDEWNIEENPEFFTVKTNLRGTAAKVLTGVMAEITITPMALSGTIASMLAKITAPFALKRGTLLFGGTDKPLVIQTVDGRSETFAAAACTGFTFTGAPGKNPFSIKFLCLRKNSTALSDAAAFVAEASSAYVEPTIDAATLVSDFFTLGWGASFPDIETSEDGFTFSPELGLFIRKTSKQGPYNAMIDDTTATVTFTPENVSAGDWYDTWLKLDGAGVRIGGVRAGDDFEEEFTATASQVDGLRLTIPRSVFTKGSVRFGVNSRVGQVTLEALRSSTGSTLFTLDQVPEP